MSETETLLRIDEVADRLGVSRVTVYRRVWNGSLPAYRLDDRGPLRIDEHDLDMWLADRRADGKAAA